MRLRSWLVVLAALIGAVPQARAADKAEKDVEAYLQTFYEAALWTGNGQQPGSIVKWTQPIRVRMTGPMSGSYADMVIERLRQLTDIAGLELTVLPANKTDENFLVEFVDTTQLIVGGQATNTCISTWRTNESGFTHAQLIINLNATFRLRRCITHESMHAMGFTGHPHASDSVLSYVYQREDLSPVDKMSLRVLYDQRLKPGTFQLAAMALARDILVDKLVADGASDDTRTLGQTYIRNLVPLTLRLAEEGNVGLQYQLGVAYTFGQVVPKDEAAGFAWLKRAAQVNQPQWRNWSTMGLFMVGLGLAAGRGIAADPAEAVRWYRLAADRGHVGAQNNLGWAYQQGQGVAADPVEAYKWYALAADKKYKLAETNLAKLAETMTAEQIEGGRRRMAEWKPPAN